VDPITLIVAALGTGLAVMGQATVTEAAKDGSQKLKSLIHSHFGQKPEHDAALAAFEKDPDGARPALVAALSEAGAHQDPAVVQAARSLLAETDPDEVATRKYSVLVQGDVKGMVTGDHNIVHMNFGDSEPKT
jgi:hypothetical protein